MAAPPHPPSPRVEDPSVDRKLCIAILRDAREALGRYGLSDADREDLAQIVAVAALRRWSTYREDVGSLRQWISGIARNEVRVLRRRQGPAAGAAAPEDPPDPVSEHSTVEEAVSQRDLLDSLLDQLPTDQRRVVTLVEMWGLTIREAATLERISPTRAHARHKAGMKALREAAERWQQEQERRGLLLLPFTIASLFAAAQPAEAAPELDDRGFQRVAAALGLDETPPESGPRRSTPIPANDDPDPPSPRPTGAGRARLLHLLGLLGAVALGMYAGMLLERRRHEPPRENSYAVALAATPVLTASAEPLPAAPTASAAPSASATAASIAPKPRTAPAHDAEDERLRAERALVDWARSAFDRSDLPGAIAALAEHARRFPDGRYAGLRERMWSAACAQARSAGATAGLGARCDRR